MSGIFGLLWLIAPFILGVYGRTGAARALHAKWTDRIYKFLMVHSFITGVMAISFFFLIFQAERLTQFFFHFFTFTTVTLSAGFSFRCWLFDSFGGGKADHVPLGVKLWAWFSPNALYNEKGLVDGEKVAEKTKKPGLRDIAAAKMTAREAKIRAYEIEVETEYMQAQKQLHDAAEAHNEAKRMTEELEKLRRRK